MPFRFVFDTSILQPLSIRYQLITFSKFCTLLYWLFWNLFLACSILHFWLLMLSIVMLCTEIFERCLECPLCHIIYCWPSGDTGLHDSVAKVSHTVWSEKTATNSIINYCHPTTLRVPNVENEKLLTVCSCWCWVCGTERDAFVFASKGGQ